MRRFRTPSVILLVIAVLLAGFSVYKTNFARNMDAPKISFEQEEVTIDVNVNEEDLLKGVTATDDQDGDVTDSLVVESLSTFMDDNTRLATYVAFDSDGNATKESRKVKYTNYVGPQFSLLEPLSFPVGTSKDLQTNIRAYDIIDGNISNSILMYPDTNLDTSIAGDYKVRFEVANSAGDVEDLNLSIKIYDTDKVEPVRVNLTDYIAYVNLGQSAEAVKAQVDSAKAEPENKKTKAGNLITGKDDLVRFIDSVSINGRKVEVTGTGNESSSDDSSSGSRSAESIRASSISIDDSGVDYGKAGVYTVTYSYSDDGNTGKATLTLVVRGEA